MAAEARRAGAAEVWGGNYGVLTPEIRPHFDRVFVGYAEHEIAQAMGQKLETLVHPPMVVPFGMPFWTIVRFGVLFTTRGCCFGCTFCQTPTFAPRPRAIPLESIDRVLRCYAENGVFDLLIPDENFGVIPGHARAAGELLARHGMLWTVMTRLDYLMQHFDEWRSQGLAGAMIGIESMDPEELKALNKRSHVERLQEALELCRRHGIVTVGFYIIGLESDTEESIRASIEQLAAMPFDLVQVCILTPLPQTPLWQRIQDTYGIEEGLPLVRREAPGVEASGPDQGTARGLAGMVVQDAPYPHEVRRDDRQACPGPRPESGALAGASPPGRQLAETEPSPVPSIALLAREPIMRARSLNIGLRASLPTRPRARAMGGKGRSG